MFDRKVTTYSSGLRHIHYYVPLLNTLLMQYSFNVGSVDEDSPELYGISHFLEHMVFNGSKNFPDRDKNEELLAQQGLYENAWTSQSETVYHILTPKRSMSECFDLLTDRVFNPLFPPEFVEKEKGIIQEELVMYENDPDSVIYQDTWSRTFVGLNYANDIIGTRESIASMSQKLLSDYHKKFYTTDNCIFFTYGGATYEEVERVVAKKFSSLKTGNISQIDRTINKVASEPIRTNHLTKDIRTGYYSKMIAIPTDIDPKLAATMVTLDMMLSGGNGSKLSQDLLYESALVGSYSMSLEFVRGYIYMVFAATTPANSIDKVKDYFHDEVLGNYEKFIIEQNIERAMNFAKGRLTRSLEDVSFLSSGATKNIDRANLYSQTNFSISDLMKAMDRVTKKDLLELIKNFSEADMWAESSMTGK